jgi:small-conductance mechanosensitive channel
MSYFLILISIIYTSFSLSAAAPAPSKIISTVTPPQQVMYLEKFSDLLNIIDDEEKRETFIKDLNQTVYSDFFSWKSLKSMLLYFIKLSIIIFAYFVLKFLGMRLLNYQIYTITQKKVIKHSKSVRHEENYLLLKTLASLFKSIFMWVLRIVFTLLFLIVLGFNISPLVYGVSFIGFGVTLASQNIIKDFINGILIIVDGSMAVGEVIQVAGHKGTVEDITLRSLSLRDKLGDLIVIPFSNIAEVLNYSRNYARLRTEIIITHDQDIKIVKQAFIDAAENFKNVFQDKIKGDFKFLGVTHINEHGSCVSGTITTEPDPTFHMRHEFSTYVHTAMLMHGVKRIDGQSFRD